MDEIVYEKSTIFSTYRIISVKGKYKIQILSHYDGDIQLMRNKKGPMVFYDKGEAIKFLDKIVSGQNNL